MHDFGYILKEPISVKKTGFPSILIGKLYHGGDDRNCSSVVTLSSKKKKKKKRKDLTKLPEVL